MRVLETCLFSPEGGSDEASTFVTGKCTDLSISTSSFSLIIYPAGVHVLRPSGTMRSDCHVGRGTA